MIKGMYDLGPDGRRGADQLILAKVVWPSARFVLLLCVILLVYFLKSLQNIIIIITTQALCPDP